MTFDDLRDYIIPLDDADKRWFDFLAKDEFWCENLFQSLDCTRIYADGSRPEMTINYGYRRNITGFLYILDKTDKSENDRKAYINKLITRHEKNISFEEEHPPVYYKSKSRGGSKASDRTTKAKDIFSDATLDVTSGSAKAVRTRSNTQTRKAEAMSKKSISFAFNNFKPSK